ncbi:MAG: hypothetical protein VYD90_11110 [Pseudomonadota bacterium]|nr:hypothetical protein [Pseudomonadota bacterium]
MKNLIAPSPCGGNVIPFPADVSLDQRIRHCRRMVAMYRDRIENCDPDSPNVQQRLQHSLAAGLLPDFEAELRALEARKACAAENATLSFNGVEYHQMAGRA